MGGVGSKESVSSGVVEVFESAVKLEGKSLATGGDGIFGATGGKESTSEDVDGKGGSWSSGSGCVIL